MKKQKHFSKIDRVRVLLRTYKLIAKDRVIDASQYRFDAFVVTVGAKVMHRSFRAVITRLEKIHERTGSYFVKHIERSVVIFSLKFDVFLFNRLELMLQRHYLRMQRQILLHDLRIGRYD